MLATFHAMNKENSPVDILSINIENLNSFKNIGQSYDFTVWGTPHNPPRDIYGNAGGLKATVEYSNNSGGNIDFQVFSRTSFIHNGSGKYAGPDGLWDGVNSPFDCTTEWQMGNNAMYFTGPSTAYTYFGIPQRCTEPIYHAGNMYIDFYVVATDENGNVASKFLYYYNHILVLDNTSSTTPIP